MNRTAALCRAAAALCALLLFAAPLATRFGLVSWKLGLPLTALAILGGAALLLVALVLVALPAWRVARAPLAASALLAALPVIAGVAMIAPGIGLPAIHDISTDIAEPPRFVALLAVRGPDANALVRSPEVDAAQRAAWPELGPLDSALPPAEAFARAARTARELGWQIQAEDAAAGLIEASATTFWFGFVDDIVIRVRPHAGGSRIDLRSVSRVGQGDLGANAKRILRFNKAFSG
jgi:uncharacterized protein (DUF1499 family)